MMVPQLAAAQAGEVGLCPVGAGTVDALAILMVDPLHGELGMKRVPGRALVGVHHSAGGDPLAEGRHGGLLAAKHLRQRAAVALAHRHDDPAFARPALSSPPVDPVGRLVRRPDVTAEIGTTGLGHPSFAADLQALYAGRHSLPQLVRQHEGRLVLHVELAGEGEHALALDLVAEASDGEQVGPQQQFVPGEQRAEVIEKSPRHALQRHRSWPAGRRHA